MPYGSRGESNDAHLLDERNRIVRLIEDARQALDEFADRTAKRALPMIEHQREKTIRDLSDVFGQLDADFRAIEHEVRQSLKEGRADSFDILVRTHRAINSLNAKAEQVAHNAVTDGVEELERISEALDSVRDDLGASALDCLLGLRIRCVKYGIEAKFLEPVPSVPRDCPSPLRAALGWLLELEAWLERSSSIRPKGTPVEPVDEGRLTKCAKKCLTVLRSRTLPASRAELVEETSYGLTEVKKAVKQLLDLGMILHGPQGYYMPRRGGS